VTQKGLNMKTVIITDLSILEQWMCHLNTRGAYRLLREHLDALIAQEHKFSVEFVEIEDKTNDPNVDRL